MRILFITTKPPWPVIDGSRLLVRHTLEGLAARGHGVSLVAPIDPGGRGTEEAIRPLCRPHLVPPARRSLLRGLLRSRLSGRPLSIERHRQEGVRREVERLLADGSFDVVHVEQLQALIQAEPAFERGVPVVMRAQNVESDLWRRTGRVRPWVGAAARREGLRLAAWEREALGRVARTVALTGRDGVRLAELAPDGGRIGIVRAPFPGVLPPAEEPLPGSPAVTLLGSEGWLPNRDAVLWFVGEIWPGVRRRLPEARLHVFGNWHQSLEIPGISWHPPPRDSRQAFPRGSIMAVPLRIASGVRMKILEAWARGVPVVALPPAAAGLETVDGCELLLARGPEEFAAAFARIHEDPATRAGLVAAGREALKERHGLADCVRKLERVYEEVVRESAPAAGAAALPSPSVNSR